MVNNNKKYSNTNAYANVTINGGNNNKQPSGQNSGTSSRGGDKNAPLVATNPGGKTMVSANNLATTGHPKPVDQIGDQTPKLTTSTRKHVREEDSSSEHLPAPKKQQHDNSLNDADDIEVSMTEDRLPAIKLKIKDVSKYTNPINLQKEIMRCKPNINSQQIKLAKLNKNILIIATDDPATHQILKEAWPTDAFTHGITQSDPKATPLDKIVIKGVDPSIQIEEINKQLTDQHLNNPFRVYKNGNNQTPTTIIKATIDKKLTNQLIKTGVYIGYTRFRVELDNKVFQCFKCQKLGHSAAGCSNQLTCVKCGENHTLKDCTAQTAKCANCGGGHAACSRACPYIKKASSTINNKKETQHKKLPHKTPNNNINKSQHPQKQNEPSPPKLEIKDIVDEVLKQLTPIINTLVTQAFNAAINSSATKLNFNSLAENAINKNLKSIANQIKERRDSLDSNPKVQNTSSPAQTPNSNNNNNKPIKSHSKQGAN